MKNLSRKVFVLMLLAAFAQYVFADVSGSWTFAVTLGDLGSGNAEITLTQEADGKLVGTYSGQLANGPIAGTYNGNNFEFAFNSDAIGGEITYRGEFADDDTVKGAAVAQ